MGWTCQRSVRDVGREGVGLIGQWTVRAGRKLTNPCTAGVMFLLPCEVWSCVRDGMGKLKQDGMINGVDVFLCGGGGNQEHFSAHYSTAKGGVRTADILWVLTST
jgi:hypothetical protein